MQNPFARTRYLTEAAYVAEEVWYFQYNPTEGVDYKRLLPFAEKRYADAEKVWEILDGKADWILRLAVAVAGVALTWHEKIGLTPLTSLPGIALLLGAAWVAMRVRVPGLRPTPVSIRDGVALLDRGENIEARLCSTFHCAVIGMLVVNEWKARQVQHATRGLILGIGVLCLCAVARQLTAF